MQEEDKKQRTTINIYMGKDSQLRPLVELAESNSLPVSTLAEVSAYLAFQNFPDVCIDECKKLVLKRSSVGHVTPFSAYGKQLQQKIAELQAENDRLRRAKSLEIVRSVEADRAKKAR